MGKHKDSIFFTYILYNEYQYYFVNLHSLFLPDKNVKLRINKQIQ